MFMLFYWRNFATLWSSKSRILKCPKNIVGPLHGNRSGRRLKPNCILFKKSLLVVECIDSMRSDFHKKMGSPGYDTKLNLMVRLQFWRSREFSILFHCHYSQVHSDWLYILGSHVSVKYIRLFFFSYSIGSCAKRNNYTRTLNAIP